MIYLSLVENQAKHLSNLHTSRIYHGRQFIASLNHHYFCLHEHIFKIILLMSEFSI